VKREGAPTAGISGAQRGFTLLEIILAVAVMGLVASSVIGLSANLLKSRPTRPDDVFWQACRAARKAALQSGHDQSLSFDPKTKAFSLTDGTSTKTFAVAGGSDSLAIDFLSGQSGGPAMLLGGTFVLTQTISGVTFFSDGTCVPFQVQIRVGGAAHVLTIDQWTCAQILTPADANSATGT
jgi:prepilin-type N-terminal cleavage/methylation domain-containing protein